MTQTKKNTVAVYLPGQKRTVHVPVDKDGYVDPDYLAKYGTYSHTDYDKSHKIVLPSKLKPNQAKAWLDDPDSCDIEEIDVLGKPRRNIGNRKGKDAEFQKKIAVYGTASEEKEIRALLDEAFPSQKDRDALTSKGDVEIIARRLKPDRLGDTNSNNLIRLGRDGGMTNDVIVHEGTHCLRNRDGRTGKTKAVSNAQYANPSYANVEESLTVAESLARKKDNGMEGYYYYVPVKDSKSGHWRSPTDAEAKTMYLQDRRLFSKGSPKTDAAAVKSVNENWGRSHISRLKIKGRGRMAINTVAAHDSSVKPIRERLGPGVHPRSQKKGGETKSSIRSRR